MSYSACTTPVAQEHQISAQARPLVHRVRDAISNSVARMEKRAALRRERMALLALSDAQLSDIGITRADAEEEYRQSYKLL